MRRMNINGNLTLMDYCTNGPQWASGGFIADSKTDTVTNGSQQQYLVRNSSIGTWSNGVWNQVFAGVNGAPADQLRPAASPTRTAQSGSGTYTTLPTNPVSREKPYLYIDSTGQLQRLRAQPPQTNSSGTTWANGPTPGTIAAAVQLLPGQAVRFRRDHQQPARQRQEPAADARRLQRRPEHRDQPVGHRRARHGHRHPDRRQRRGPDRPSATSRASSSPES